MDHLHYAGLDVHKKSIAFCIKLIDGQKACLISSKSCHILTRNGRYTSLDTYNDDARGDLNEDEYQLLLTMLNRVQNKLG